jgi:chemotaxis methyl-accepting protein methylase
MIRITPEEIDLLSRYVYDISGIQVDAGKAYLLESRFHPLLVANGCQSYAELYHRSRADTSGVLMNEIIDAITTNETYFFRDNRPYELMTHKIVPDLIDRRRREYGSGRMPLKIWSAACSTGQEIYSIAITLLEMLRDSSGFNINILGTDISDSAVARASYGEYNQFEIERGLPRSYLQKYFYQTARGWRIRDEVRTMARFEKRDLIKPFTELGKFDLIFCRNVAIYFSPVNKVQLFKRIAHALAPGGALIVGASESLSGIAPDFEPRHYLKGLYYQLKADVAAGISTPTAFDRQRPTPPVIPAPRPRPAPASTPIVQSKAPSPPRTVTVETKAHRPVHPQVVRPARPQAVQPQLEAAGELPSPSPLTNTPRLATVRSGTLLSNLRQTPSDRSSLLSAIGRQGQERRRPLLSTIGLKDNVTVDEKE